LIAWTDQFQALLRDKVYNLMKAIEVSQFDNIRTEFPDPYDDDRFALIFEDDAFYLTNLTQGEGVLVELDISKLGLA
jgi:hypothetical protein